MVELNCETDFVAKGADFQNALGALAAQVATHGDADIAGQAFEGSTVGETITQMGSTLGERIELGRTARYETADGILDAYKHIQNDRGTIGVLVELGGVDAGNADAQAVAHDIALHIASAAPRYVSKDDVPADAIEKERELLTELTRNEGKPENAIEKIVDRPAQRVLQGLLPARAGLREGARRPRSPSWSTASAAAPPSAASPGSRSARSRSSWPRARSGGWC